MSRRVYRQLLTCEIICMHGINVLYESGASCRKALAMTETRFGQKVLETLFGVLLAGKGSSQWVLFPRVPRSGFICSFWILNFKFQIWDFTKTHIPSLIILLKSSSIENNNYQHDLYFLNSTPCLPLFGSYTLNGQEGCFFAPRTRNFPSVYSVVHPPVNIQSNIEQGISNDEEGCGI